MINAKQFEQAAVLFLKARACSGVERERLIAETCAQDPIVGRQMQRLLASDAEEPHFLDEPLKLADQDWSAAGLEALANPKDAFPSLTDFDVTPLSIGCYTVESRLGGGGMGVVYQAWQEAPRRTVAVKVIRLGFASETALSRFQHEVEVLARLQHPGIAHIYEAGVAEIRYANGSSVQRPFFAMELVRGRPLTQFARENKLGTRARLELMARICDAIHYAHQRGVIHRDLKPGNILVVEEGFENSRIQGFESEEKTVLAFPSTPRILKSSTPQPKILDFGVARVTDADAQSAALRTHTGQLIGTAAYMSPEQIQGDAAELDTRSDVYALGVVLYELLAGRLPHDVAGQSVFEAVRLIRENPPRRLGTVHTALRGDIETIVHKALEKERTRRYQSAAELATDIRRYLADEPILARPPSLSYQLLKFTKRNRSLVGGVVIAFFALVGGASAAIWQAVKAVQEAQRAGNAERDAKRQQALAETRLAQVQTARQDAETAIQFLVEALGSADPERLGRDVRVTDILEAASRQVAERWNDQPLLEARVRDAIGGIYHVLGKHDQAQPHLERAYALRKDALDANDPLTLASAVRLARLYDHQGRFADAEALLRPALAAMRQAGPLDATGLEALGNLAGAYTNQKRFTEAEQLYREAIAAAETLLGGDAPTTLNLQNSLAVTLDLMGQPREAQPLYEHVLEARRRVLGEESPGTLETLSNLAALYRAQGQMEQAEKMFVAALAAQRRVLGEEHRDTLQTMNNLAVLYREGGRFADAEALLRELAQKAARVFGAEDKRTLTTQYNLASLYAKQDRYEEAETLARTVLDAQRRTLGERHPDVALSLNALAQLRSRQGDEAAAEPLYAQALDVLEAALPPNHPNLSIVRMRHGQSLLRLQRFSEAEAALKTALAQLEAALGREHPSAKAAREALLQCYEMWGKPEEAARYRATPAGEDAAPSTNPK